MNGMNSDILYMMQMYVFDLPLYGSVVYSYAYRFDVLGVQSIASVG
jgi:hypothetical protein